MKFFLIRTILNGVGKFTRLIAFTLSISIAALAQNPGALFDSHCGSCHNAASSAGAPLPETLRKMPWKTILSALDSGKMKSQGAALSAAERESVARHLGTGEEAETMPASANCSPQLAARPFRAPFTGGWNGWGTDDTNSRFQSAKVAGLNVASIPKL